MTEFCKVTLRAVWCSCYRPSVAAALQAEILSRNDIELLLPKVLGHRVELAPELQTKPKSSVIVCRPRWNNLRAALYSDAYKAVLKPAGAVFLVRRSVGLRTG